MCAPHRAAAGLTARTAGTMQLATDTVAADKLEPLLAPNPQRFVLFPIKHHQVWEMYKKHEVRPPAPRPLPPSRRGLPKRQNSPPHTLRKSATFLRKLHFGPTCPKVGDAHSSLICCLQKQLPPLKTCNEVALFQKTVCFVVLRAPSITTRINVFLL